METVIIAGFSKELCRVELYMFNEAILHPFVVSIRQGQRALF